MKYELNNTDNTILESNKEIVDDLKIVLNENIKIYSRDWTVQTIYQQVMAKNIDLNPRFQRRNAWTDEKRSLLIESLILKLPVPEIVLAESHFEKNKFIVLDGKQRLLTIMGFFEPEQFEYWDKPKLKNLKFLKDLNDKTWKNIENDANLLDSKRAFENSDFRCTVVFNQSSDDILYEIFYRLNSGAVPLSMQELRQSLQKGDFSNYLIDITNIMSPIHNVLGLESPDKRLVDSEIILKFIANKFNISNYKGNLKTYLDEVLIDLNKNWQQKKQIVENLYTKFNTGIAILEKLVGKDKSGRYFDEKRFNRNIFDVQIFFASELTENDIDDIKINAFQNALQKLSEKNSEFRDSLVSTTTSLKNIKKRYLEFGNEFDKIFNKQITPIFN